MYVQEIKYKVVTLPESIETSERQVEEMLT